MSKYANMQDMADACGLVSSVILTGKLDDVIGAVADNPQGLESLFSRTSAALGDRGYDEVLMDARVAYTRLFCNAAARGLHPFESVYRGKSHLLMQEPRDAVLAFYREYGFAPNADLHLPEDYLPFELAFIQELIVTGNKDAARRFIDEHLGAWLPYACDDMEKLTEDPFWLDICSLLRAITR